MKDCETVAKVEPTIRILSRPGFSPDFRHFVRNGDDVVATKASDAQVWIDARLPEDLLRQCRRSGSLQGWQQLEAFAEGNRLFIFLLALAFVGPINAICGQANSSFLLSGKAGSGKTAICRIIGAVWGWDAEDDASSRLGYGMSLNATDNSQEPMVATRRHMLAFLDEASHHAGGDLRKLSELIANIAFRFEGGSSKRRMTESEAPLDLSTVVLITANHAMPELSAHARQPFGRQHYDRMIDLEVPDRDSGVFDDLHGRGLGETFQLMDKITSKNHGVAGAEFVRKLITAHRTDPRAVKKDVEAREKLFRDKLLSAMKRPVSAEFERPLRSFGRAFAAIDLARRFGIITLSRATLGQAVLTQCLAYLRRQQSTATPVGPPLSPEERLKQFIRERAGKFPAFDQALTAERIQHEGAFLDARGNLLLTVKMMVSIVGSSADAKRLKRQLVAEGMLGITSQGEGKSRNSVKFIVGPKRQKVDLIQLLARFVNNAGTA
ncbi:hypothetical protein AXW83_15085 [Bosea sp. PAMC 26642]|nr:hypothetical protein AXW83_15085 [Bosea sp. PAMC 26642]